MNSRVEKALIEKLRTLPTERLAEVEDFVDFLRSRDDHRSLVGATAKSAEPVFAKIWDNDQDAAYDQL